MGHFVLLTKSEFSVWTHIPLYPQLAPSYRTALPTCKTDSPEPA